MSEDFWDEKYDVDDFRYGTEPNPFVAEQAVEWIPAQGRVLCLGAGEGRNAVWLAEQGFLVTAVDQSGVGLSKLEQLAEDRDVHVSTVKDDVEHYEADHDEYDAVVLTYLHLAEPARKRVHAKVVDALREGGVVILEAFHPDQHGRGTGGPPSAELMYSPETLREDFGGLHIEELDQTEVEMTAGHGHRGKGAVVRLVARKK